MKIVNIEDFFHPDAGYQLNILAKYMSKFGHDVTIITAETEKIPDYLKGFFDCTDIERKDKEYSQKYNVNICRIPLKRFVSGRAQFSSSIFDVIRNISPDVVFIHGNNTLIAMQYLLKRERFPYPIVMDCHMLEMASRNRFKKVFEMGYKKVFAPIIIKDKIPVIRTQDDKYVQKCLGVPLEQSPWISVGSDTILFHRDEENRGKFRIHHEIPNDAFVILYAGKLDETKGGMLLAEALRKRFNTQRQVVGVIVGKTIGEYGEKVETLFSGSENRIVRLPTQKYENLAAIYQACDVAVFPRQCSLSFYDVQACGLPVVFEDNQINIDRAKHNNAYTFKAGDTNDLIRRIQEIIDMPIEEYAQVSKNAELFVRDEYNYEDIAAQYMMVIEQAIRDQQ